MKVTKEEGRAIIWGDTFDWEKVSGTEEIIDQRRWCTVLKAIFKHNESGKFFSLSWERGSTECQETELFEYDDPELTEMEQKEVTKLTWVKKENK